MDTATLLTLHDYTKQLVLIAVGPDHHHDYPANA